MSAETPSGYTMPKAAADLIAHAEANGWRTAIEWHGNEWAEAFVHVHVARAVRPGEDPVHPTDPYATVRDGLWLYQVCWHSRDAAPGKLKLFRRSLAKTPWSPRWHDGPSVKGIRLMISSNPLTSAREEDRNHG